MSVAGKISGVYDQFMFAGNTREKLAGQVRDAAERIAHSITGVFMIALAAIAIASGALYISIRALKAATA